MVYSKKNMHRDTLLWTANKLKAISKLVITDKTYMETIISTKIIGLYIIATLSYMLVFFSMSFSQRY